MASSVPSLRLLSAAAATGLPAQLTLAPLIPVDLAAYASSVRLWAGRPASDLRTLTRAARCGSMEGVQWAARNRAACPSVSAGAGALPRLCSVLAPGVCPRCYESARALRLAAEGGYLEVVRWLWDTSDVTSGQYALTGAASHGQLHVVQWFVVEGRLSPEGFGGEALRDAIHGGHVPVVEWLVGVAGARPSDLDLVPEGDANAARDIAGQARALEWLTGPESGLEWGREDLRFALFSDNLRRANGRRPRGASGVVLRKALARHDGRRTAPRRRVQAE